MMGKTERYLFVNVRDLVQALSLKLADCHSPSAVLKMQSYLHPVFIVTLSSTLN